MWFREEQLDLVSVLSRHLEIYDLSRYLLDVLRPDEAHCPGEREFVRIAVVADSGSLTPPCGACRQVLWEHCGDIEIVLSNLSGDKEVVRLSELLPRPFDGSILG